MTDEQKAAGDALAFAIYRVIEDEYRSDKPLRSEVQDALHCTTAWWRAAYGRILYDPESGLAVRPGEAEEKLRQFRYHPEIVEQIHRALATA